ncbi:cell division protein SepF [Aciduricibacillus chroicocephali]|uniref:Cell division protein SepF n=1 Tax=Aciduricibacillus chroicocephali TaxID=3054939 RepID=A0ABY9KXT9_9BACI|nr:cell division protein SepF [Bacillaceae bacterium 44XB]
MSFKNKIKSFFTMDDEYEYIEEEVEEPVKEPSPYPVQKEKSDKVVSLKALQQSNAKLVICEPRSFNEAKDIADNLINRRAVIINFQMLNSEIAKSFIDFLSGTVYALNGSIQKLGPKTFLCTPDNVDVSGAVSEIFNDEEQFR